jgi:hypothetical protein
MWYRTGADPQVHEFCPKATNGFITLQSFFVSSTKKVMFNRMPL